MRDMRFGVLLQMVTTAKGFVADFARIRTESGMNALMACQLLIAGERFAAGYLVTLERSFT